jgi:hypothetical protein
MKIFKHFAQFATLAKATYSLRINRKRHKKMRVCGAGFAVDTEIRRRLGICGGEVWTSNV